MWARVLSVFNAAWVLIEATPDGLERLFRLVKKLLIVIIIGLGSVIPLLHFVTQEVGRRAAPPAIAATLIPTCGALGGSLVSERGEPVRGAIVALGRAGHPGDTWSGRSDEDGRYCIPQLFPGTYELTIRAPGYEPATQRVSLTREAINIAINTQLRTTLRPKY
ncbi:MAG TPA: carboxypeptidase-like regulatory domain-containing protein [Bryobacteraceae bacterium]|jgi:hypothetical protein